ncbi:DoxX family protein [Streptomyces harbinensis]|uniref:DoxX-like family protein n=1 Tax=Streptomyces harbinensis TaxID=1176198 RepID=A0A1I6NVV1_9ACTN|nr:DoxX family protein [Streptomyces harbinensis]SFS32077.1 DoxX-like family protein [Streptomyces harbinensis]
MTTPPHPRTDHSPRALTLGLWSAQGLLAAILVGGGLWKLAAPLDQVAEAFAWAGELPGLLRASAGFDILGGLGVLLPSVTRVRPQLAVLAALGVVALMGSAIVFHLARGEGADTGFNAVLTALALFVAWGRHRKAPIAPRP